MNKVGLDTEWYYNNTLRNCAHRAKAWEHQQLMEWERTRYTSFTILRSSYFMDNSPIFKNVKSPEDVFNLSTDPKPVVLEGKDAQRALDSLL